MAQSKFSRILLAFTLVAVSASAATNPGTPATQPSEAQLPEAPPAEAAPGEAPPANAASLRAELLAKMAAINAQQRALLEKMQEVDQQRRELELMMSRVTDPGNYRAGADATTAPPAEVGTERKAQAQAEKDKIPELPRISAEVGGVLSPKGRITLEPSLQYTYSSVNRLSIEGFTILPALLIGSVDVQEADRDTVIGAVSARYGLTSRIETELRVPYVYRRDSTRTREILDASIRDQIFTGEGNDIGDIEFDLRYQLPRISPNWPWMVANVRTKAPTGTDPFEIQTDADAAGQTTPPDELPTGTGFWSFNPSMTFIYPSDPVVLFGNLGYLWTKEDDKDGNFGDVDPGDAVRMNFGMGFGLNDRTSFSLSYSLDLFNRTEIELFDTAAAVLQRQKITGSDVTVGRFLLGFSLRTPGGTPLNLSIGIGATDDAPDTDITFRVPFTVKQ